MFGQTILEGCFVGNDDLIEIEQEKGSKIGN
jgi:hypothetical protein